MPEAHAFLQEWAVRFFRNRDVIQREIMDITEGGEGISIRYSHKEVRVLSIPDLAQMEMLLRRGKEEHLIVVTFNTEKNVDAVVQNWSVLVQYHSLTLYFVNPWSAEEKWALNPRLHQQIADEHSLRQGLLSLFVMVPALQEREIAQHLGASREQ
ncbi:hypothetical protein HY491_02935 [Candidatus Woesearchaeota archaeon]|nr:hypothetical protein [Candidatus Woesearchaeota archaeon]